MAEDNPYVRGDILIDTTITFTASDALSCGISHLIETKRIRSSETAIDTVAQLVEAIVVHERLVILEPRNTPKYDFGEGYKKICKIEPLNHTTHRYDGKVIENDYYTLKPFDLASTSRMVSRRYGVAYRSLEREVVEFFFGYNGNVTDGSRYSHVVDAIVGKIEGEAKNEIEAQNVYLKDYFSLDVPIIFNYILEKAKRREDIIPIALELRETKEARSFRRQLTLLDEAAAVDDRVVVKQIIGELDDKIKSLGKKIDQPTLDLEIAMPLSVALNVPQVAKLVVDKVVHRPKRHLVFIEQLYESGKQARTVRRHLGKLL